VIFRLHAIVDTAGRRATALCLMFFLVLPSLAKSAELDRVDLAFNCFQETEPLTIEDVRGRGDLPWSDPVQSVRPGPGGRPVWIELPALRPGAILELSQVVDEAVLYEEMQDGGWRISQTGDSVPPTGRALPIARMAFELSDEARPEAKRFLKVTHPIITAVGLTAWDPVSFRKDFERRRLVQTLLLGFVIAIVIYNIVISVIVRDKVFAWNAAVITSLIVVDLYLSGVGAAWLWPKTLSNVILNVALFGVVFLGAKFLRSFVTPDTEYRLRMPGLGWVSGFAVLAVLLHIFIPYWLIQSALLILIVAFLAVGVFSCMREALQGNRRARLILFPLVGVMLPGGFLVLVRVLTDLHMGALRPHLLEGALAFEALAFSLALAARIRIHAAEAEGARADLVRAELDAARTFADLQDRERARIASDLHDSIGHDLVMASGLLNAGRQGADRQKLDEADTLLRNTLSSVRRLSHDLHPATICHLGWEGAVRSLFSTLESTYGIEVILSQGGGAPRLAEARQTHLYRVLQEIVSNIARHSQAGRCDVEMVNTGRRFRVRIADDGIGLPQGGAGRSGLGFASIDQRVKSLHGDWRLGSSREGGVEIAIDIPLGERGVKA